MIPGQRTLMQVTIPEEENAATSKAVKDLMGNKPELRFQFIQKTPLLPMTLCWIFNAISARIDKRLAEAAKPPRLRGTGSRSGRGGLNLVVSRFSAKYRLTGRRKTRSGTGPANTECK